MASQGRQSDAGLFADWRPDWLSQSDATPRRSTIDHLHGGPAPSDRNSVRLSSISNGNSSAGDTFRNAEDPEAAKEEDPSALTPARYEVETTQDKAVNRRLGGIHIFMITISGVLGVGLYVRGGTILRLGGPIAVLLSFALLGALAWGVMQCIAEMLCIWPISGALHIYVTEFVDPELGTVVGVAYWYTYAISFAALVAASAGIAEYWETPKGIQGGVLFFLVPAALVIINAFGIQLYGLMEVIGGTLKLSFLAVITLFMIAINQGAGSQEKLGTSLYPETVIVRDEEVTDSWAQAFFMSLSIAAFAYVGIEITAASALEARVTKERPTSSPKSRTIGRTVKFSAIWIPFFAGFLYVLAGTLVTLNIRWDDPRLPRMSWRPETDGNPAAGSTSSAFVLVAEDSGVPGLASTMNLFLMFTALTCANTNLYVASRTLFALTRNIESGPNTPWYDKILAYFGRTNNKKVPLAAILASCIFAWIPFLYLATEHGPNTSIGAILDVLSEMGTIGVIVVWACECWAYIRFHNVVMNNKEALHGIPYVRRWDRNKSTDDYPYRSHGQPITAYASLLGCLLILFVANGASLWKEFRIQQFLAAYLAPICFLLLWLVLKLRQGSRSRWRLVDLSNGDELVNKIYKLHELRWRSADASNDSERSFQNLWGLL